MKKLILYWITFFLSFYCLVGAAASENILFSSAPILLPPHTKIIHLPFLTGELMDFSALKIFFVIKNFVG